MGERERSGHLFPSTNPSTSLRFAPEFLAAAASLRCPEAPIPPPPGSSSAAGEHLRPPAGFSLLSLVPALSLCPAHAPRRHSSRLLIRVCFWPCWAPDQHNPLKTLTEEGGSIEGTRSKGAC